MRLGLLELRAFEMAPHGRMGLLEMLLVRALICMFWKKPFEGALVRWGTALHDRFMLPEFVRRDFWMCSPSYAGPGMPSRTDGLLRTLSSAFQKSDRSLHDGVELELRHALEPWNVLAEETTSGGTVRIVDSSLERIQVKAVWIHRRIPLRGHMQWAHSAAPSYRRSLEKPWLASGIAPGDCRIHCIRQSLCMRRWSLTLLIAGKNVRLAAALYHVGAPDGQPYTSRPADANGGRTTAVGALSTNRFRNPAISSVR